MKQHRLVVDAIFIALVLSAIATTPAEAQTITQIIDASGVGPGHGLDYPQSIAVDSSGNLYVIGYRSNNVFKITPNGSITEVINSANALQSPYGIAVDGEDNVYVSGANSNNVFKVTPRGDITEVINAVNHPYGIAVDGSGNIYLAMPANSCAYKVAPGGVKTVIVANGLNGITLSTPTSIAVDASSNVYVAGQGSHNVFRITPSGVITEIINGSGDGTGHALSNPWSLTVDGSGNVYVSGQSSNNVFRITPEGEKTQIIESSHGLRSPRDIAVDGSGNVYVAGNLSSNAFKIAPDGDITQIINSTGDGVHPFTWAYGIGVDRSSHVYISGQYSKNVFKIAPAGPANLPPVAVAGGPYTGDESSEVTFDGTGSSDPDGDSLTYAWDFGDGDVGSGPMAAHTYADNGVYDVSLTVTDPDGASSTQDTTATIANVPPAVTPIAAPVDPIQLGTEDVCATAGFVDVSAMDAHTAEWDWGDEVIGPGTVDEALGFGSVSDCHVYTEAGIYTIDLKVTDDDGDSGQSEFQYVVVYDPQGGFVTGGGWIDSPAGAYRPDPSLCGKANFGFVSKYKKGASTPTGQTEFVFRAGDLNFHSSSYDWLVVTGSNYARFKGSGTINGYGDYKFMLWAGDGPDTFRIRIWTEDAAGVETDVYDNGRDQPIGDGSIVIHTK